MKKGLVLVLALILVLSVTVIVLAQPNDVSVNITPESAADDRIEVELGDTVLLTATATLGSGNYTFVEDSWTNADRQTGPIEGDTAGVQFLSTALFNSGSYSIGDEITVNYWIKVSRGTSVQEPYFEDNDDAYIEVVEEIINGEVTIVIKPMAAPAVAAHILHFNEVKPLLITGEGRNRTQVNMIAAVAHHMSDSKTTYFYCEEVGEESEGYLIPKSIIKNIDGVDTEVSNPEYWEAVLCFLNDQFGLVLEMPDEAYLEGLME